MNDRDQTFLDQQRRLHIAKASRRNQEDSSATINNSNPVNATATTSLNHGYTSTLSTTHIKATNHQSKGGHPQAKTEDSQNRNDRHHEVQQVFGILLKLSVA